MPYRASSLLILRLNASDATQFRISVDVFESIKVENCHRGEQIQGPHVRTGFEDNRVSLVSSQPSSLGDLFYKGGHNLASEGWRR